MKCIGFFVLGLLLIGLALSVPSLFYRFHLGSQGFAVRTEWRLLIFGVVVSIAAAYILFTKKDDGT
jgi:hypothetical protein